MGDATTVPDRPQQLELGVRTSCRRLFGERGSRSFLLDRRPQRLEGASEVSDIFNPIGSEMLGKDFVHLWASDSMTNPARCFPGLVRRGMSVSKDR